MIVSPIFLGIIFFGMFTPIAIVMYVIRRDELRLRLENKSSYWINHDSTNQKVTSFKQQF